MPWDNKPVCPYCRHYHREFIDGLDIVDEFHCAKCGKGFLLSVSVRYDYHTKPLEEKDDAH
jgi:transposase-like protein